MKLMPVSVFILAGVIFANTTELQNDLYRVTLLGRDALVSAKNTPTQKLIPEFTIMYSSINPGFDKNHTNYHLSHRYSILWPHCSKDLKFMNEWINSPDMKAIHGFAEAEITKDRNGKRVWRYKDQHGRIQATVQDRYARGTSNPFFAGERFTVTASRAVMTDHSIVWDFDEHPYFTLHAELMLSKSDGDPQIRYTFKVKKPGYYSAAFTGAPQTDADIAVPVPQQAAGRGLKQFNHLISEAYLKLPRVHMATQELNYAIVVDPAESPFRLPSDGQVSWAIDGRRNDSRFGLAIQRENGKLKPVAFAPIMGGFMSKMNPGDLHSFNIHYVQRSGDWKDTYRYIARKIYKFRDVRDNSGPGSLNSTIENIVDYCIDRDGHNYAMWHAEQKYYNYWSDKSGVFKPFSPIFGLTAAIVTDDEEFYWKRALPAVEFAVSRKNNVFSPYDLFDNGMISNIDRRLGSPYVSAVQLVSLYHMFRHHTYAFKLYAEEKGFSQSPMEILARQSLLEEKQRRDFAELLPARMRTGDYMDMLELYESTKDRAYLEAAVNGAYHCAATLNLFPMVPEKTVTLEVDNRVPIHAHSYGRHKAWGFPPPESIHAPQQTVPAWRASLIGIASMAYRGEYWMNNHGALMRIATYAEDPMLADLARWGMVGRFANYPGDNRSHDSLIAEYPNAPLRYIYEANFATFNPGHAWDFLGAAIDFLIADVFNRSEKNIDFPARSMSGAGFRTRAYGDRAGIFYDENNVTLWLPRNLVSSTNKQIDYIAGYGNKKFYIAFWNQSFSDEEVTVTLNKNLVDCISTHTAKVWKDNQEAGTVRISNNTLNFQIAPKGIAAYAIDHVQVKTSLHKKMFDNRAVALGPQSIQRLKSPFGDVHAMLISMGKGLTSAFIYTDALPEDVISATFRYRQRDGEWKEVQDEIFPYELSVGVDETAGDFECVVEIENADQQIQKSQVATLKF